MWPEAQQAALELLVLLLAVAVTTVLLPRRRSPRFARLWRFPRSPTAFAVLLGVAIFAGAGARAAILGTPVPFVNDEFSYLLGADTFAHFRLTNPPHPLWPFFESIHIIVQPTYASKYPPAQALLLAIGQITTGAPVVGVWLGMGLAATAMAWMFQAWFPPRWARYAAMIAALHLTFLGGGRLAPWGYSYWGGGAAVIGGALLFGGVRRLVDRPQIAAAVAVGGGLAILANTRPFEGMLVGVVPACVLAIYVLRHRREPRTLVRMVAPIVVVLGVTGAAMAAYDRAVTGSPLTLPYAIHEQAYGVTPLFLFGRARPQPPPYRHQALRNFHTGYALQAFESRRTPRGFLAVVVFRLVALGAFFLGGALVMMVAGVACALRDRWTRIAFASLVVVVVALLAETWFFPHYAAPAAPLIYVVVTQSLRRLRAWHRGQSPMVRTAVDTVVPVLLVSVVASLFLAPPPSEAFGRARAKIVAELSARSGRDLVIVRYRPDHFVHEEWVYNEADIDGARVVWARDMGDANARLLEYFRDRKIWLLEADEQPHRLVPWRN
jgi:hypothetical protein